MGYDEKVLIKIHSMEQRTGERETLWQTIIDAFEKEGADGVSEELSRQMADINKEFDTMISGLERML